MYICDQILFWVITFDLDVIETQIGCHSKGLMLVDKVWGMRVPNSGRNFCQTLRNFCRNRIFLEISSKISKILKVDNFVCLMSANTFLIYGTLKAMLDGSNDGSKVSLRLLLA